MKCNRDRSRSLRRWTPCSLACARVATYKSLGGGLAVGGAIIYQEDDGLLLVALGVKLIHHGKPNATPHLS